MEGSRFEWQPGAPCFLNPPLDLQDERTQEAIINHAVSEWENLRRLPNYCQRLVESAPERLDTIIQADGGWGKY